LNESPDVTLPARALLGALALYRATASRMLPPSCRFVPSCSEYAVGAVRARGALGGSWLALRRLLRCHPLGGHGLDPVPPRGKR
jgi:putative membrane protein insertion efficiency factor